MASALVICKNSPYTTGGTSVDVSPVFQQGSGDVQVTPGTTLVERRVTGVVLAIYLAAVRLEAIGNYFLTRERKKNNK